jgi:fatty-acyl-CoA synthase
MHYADVIEGYAERAPDAIALSCGEHSRSWSEFESRAARLARAFTEAGLGPDAKVGLLLYNCCEYYEGFLAALKERMVPINVNYRYVGEELAYLLDDADAEALVFHGSLGARVEGIVDRLPALKLLVEVDDGGPSLVTRAERYDDVLSRCAPAPPKAREFDDAFILYTGGTTGMPKGVVYDVGEWMSGVLQVAPLIIGPSDVPPSLDALLQQGAAGIEDGTAPVVLPCPPLMHTAGLSMSVMVQLLGGRAVLLTGRSFNATEVWSTVERERVTLMIIVGDAFATPLLAALHEADRPWDLTSLQVISSSGVMWSPAVKQGLLEYLDCALIDGIGATEGGIGVQVTRRGGPTPETGRFVKLGATKLFSEDDREIEPGTGKAGLIAAGGAMIPKGYHKDPEKSARTFREIDGVRYAFTGDWGRLEADGSLVLLGRGSSCINTAGEKVYPEEVEEAIKTHPQIADALVVGIPDDRFGQRVAAVVAPSGAGCEVADLDEHLKDRLAGYKRPRTIVLTAAVKRAPNGKGDYAWAREAVLQGNANSH